MIQNPKSKIPKIRPKKFGFWILGIWDFGFWGFWILDFGDFGLWGILDFSFAFGILGILDFGLWGFWDFGDFGFWILGIWGILDLGFWGFWIFADFGDFGFSGFWGGPGDVPLGNLAVGCLEVRGSNPPWSAFGGHFKNQLSLIELGQGSKLNIFSEVRTLRNRRKT